MTTLERDILALSSGTIATLTGRADYQSIDDIQGDFLTFVRYRYPNRRQPWPHWMAAWSDFVNRPKRNPHPFELSEAG